MGIEDSGIIPAVFVMATIIFFLTNALQEIKGWNYNGLASIPKLLVQIVKVDLNPDPVESGVSWSKKVSVALAIVSAAIFAFLVKVQNAGTEEITQITLLTLPFWIMGVVLPLVGILSNRSMVLFVKFQIRDGLLIVMDTRLYVCATYLSSYRII